jgi:hypothetical protein
MQRAAVSDGPAGPERGCYHGPSSSPLSRPSRTIHLSLPSLVGTIACGPTEGVEGTPACGDEPVHVLPVAPDEIAYPLAHLSGGRLVVAVGSHRTGGMTLGNERSVVVGPCGEDPVPLTDSMVTIVVDDHVIGLRQPDAYLLDPSGGRRPRLLFEDFLRYTGFGFRSTPFGLLAHSDSTLSIQRDPENAGPEDVEILSDDVRLWDDLGYKGFIMNGTLRGSDYHMPTSAGWVVVDLVTGELRRHEDREDEARLCGERFMVQVEPGLMHSTDIDTGVTHEATLDPDGTHYYGRAWLGVFDVGEPAQNVLVELATGRVFDVPYLVGPKRELDDGRVILSSRDPLTLWTWAPDTQIATPLVETGLYSHGDTAMLEDMLLVERLPGPQLWSFPFGGAPGELLAGAGEGSPSWTDLAPSFLRSLPGIGVLRMASGGVVFTRGDLVWWREPASTLVHVVDPDDGEQILDTSVLSGGAWPATDFEDPRPHEILYTVVDPDRSGLWRRPVP